MVKKKQSRVPSRARPKKLDTTTDGIEDEERQENLKKRLEDFDHQVLNIVEQMEQDTDGMLASIKELYFKDEKYTAMDVNEMKWLDYLKRNIPQPRVRQSIDALITLAESQPAAMKRKRKKNIPTSNIPAFGDTPQVVTQAKTRGRPKQNVLKESQVDNLAPPTARATRCSSRKKWDPLSTPMNTGIGPIGSNFVTPKFDTRTPLHAMTSLRTPRIGEIAMSLKGSPLQVGPKEILESLVDENLDSKTRQELIEFHEKIGKLLM